jgi:hypothetical protein
MQTYLSDPPRSGSSIIASNAVQWTLGSIWLAATGRAVDDETLDWPPDIFALTHVALDRTEAYRFVVSPPAGRQWPPVESPQWADEVTRAARRWCRWAEERRGPPPQLVTRQWQIVRGAAATAVDDVASGGAWRLCQALLTLHAIADEACAGVGIQRGPGEHAGISFRARARELLTRTGSMARIEPRFLRVLPKYRTPPGGISARSICRYASVAGPNVDFRVHQVAKRRTAPPQGQLNVLLLPWPLRVSQEDFQPVPGSVNERDFEPYGYFDFSPSEPFDVSRVDQLLAAAIEHVDSIDIVVLPESSVPKDEVARLEAVLARHGVTMLVAGVRGSADQSGSLTSNWVHFGASISGQWWHYRQDKHHRWSLDPDQIDRYHLGDVLDPRVRWWEALELRPRSVQLIERGDGHTIASLVCEDLAHIDEVVDLMRVVGPTLIIALLLDGPQVSSRWTARYASVLVDDPGSAVLALTSFGMVRRAKAKGEPPSSVVGFWKDAAHGTTEIALAADTQAVLLTANMGAATRRAADGRYPEGDTADLTLAKIRQIRSSPRPARRPLAGGSTLEPPTLSPSELAVLLSWSDAIDEARHSSPRQLDRVLADARAGAAWRAELALGEPAAALTEALHRLTVEGTVGRRWNRPPAGGYSTSCRTPSAGCCAGTGSPPA